MENNSDKQLRDKLSSTEFPFDPQAWEQMEAMLDGKKKRRGFLWWWTGGIAAALLFGVIGYELRGIVGSKQLAGSKAGSSEIRNQKSEENTTVIVGSGSKKSNVNKQESISDGKKPEIRNQKSEKQFLTKNQSAKSDESAVKRILRSSKSQQTSRHKNSFKKKIRETTLAQLANGKSNRNANQVVAQENPFKKEVEMLNAASAKVSSEETIGLSRQEASLLESVSENATTSFDKKEEDVLPKKKKKICNYSIGVLANVTGTTTGRKDNNPNVPINNGPYYFSKSPSYMLGFTHDFLFVNRVAITNSILFSQTSFKVYNPKIVSFSTAPTNYTSQITELVIPIGIKVYPVAKNNFRFYINTGIINHIKLRETFNYTMPADTAFNATANLFDQAVFPAQTNFGTNIKTQDALGVANAETSTKDFSINSAKRYYASFYASAGFEFIAKKHFILFTEPMFYMSLQKIGVQDKSKYNIGLAGGFRYQF